MNESELVKRCKAGDRQAQKELYERSAHRIYGLLLKLTANEHDALDLAQDIYFRAFQRIDQFDEHSAFSTWLYRIAYNEALQKHRRSTTFHRKVEEIKAGAQADYDDSAATIRRIDVQDALFRLPMDERALLLLRYQQGLDYRSIAEVTGLPEGTIASRLHRARGILRAVLKDGYASGEEKPIVVHPINDGRGV